MRRLFVLFLIALLVPVGLGAQNGAKTASSSVTRPANTTQYAAGEVVTDGSATRLTFTGLAPKVAEGGVITYAIAMSSAAQATKPDLELWLFSADITDLDADNAVWTPTDTQMGTLVGVVSFAVANWKTGDVTSGAGGNAVCVVANTGVSFVQATDKLYGVLIVRNTYTPVSGEIFTVTLTSARAN